MTDETETRARISSRNEGGNFIGNDLARRMGETKAFAAGYAARALIPLRDLLPRQIAREKAIIIETGVYEIGLLSVCVFANGRRCRQADEGP